MKKIAKAIYTAIPLKKELFILLKKIKFKLIFIFQSKNVFNSWLMRKLILNFIAA